MIRQLRKARDLQRLTIHAVDGEIGKPEELYFDDSTWSVRYLVINTGTWLLGRRVLIAPVVITEIDDSASAIKISLTQEQVRNSPLVDTKKPISRQYEEEYYRYYEWAPYWGAGVAVEPYPPPPRGIARSLDADDISTRDIRQTHLRSSNEVRGYNIEARDGEIGHVEELIIDDESWTVAYFEVDTRNWWPGKKVLVSRTWIDDIDWLESKVRINLERRVIQSAPEYNPSDIISRDYELRLFEHYSKHTEDSEAQPSR